MHITASECAINRSLYGIGNRSLCVACAIDVIGAHKRLHISYDNICQLTRRGRAAETILDIGKWWNRYAHTRVGVYAKLIRMTLSVDRQSVHWYGICSSPKNTRSNLFKHSYMYNYFSRRMFICIFVLNIKLICEHASILSRANEDNHVHTYTYNHFLHSIYVSQSSISINVNASSFPLYRYKTINIPHTLRRNESPNRLTLIVHARWSPIRERDDCKTDTIGYIEKTLE